jgi:hypothetical protein
MIFNRLRVSASHLTSDSLTVSTDLLVPINAFSFPDYTQFARNRQEISLEKTG